MIGNLEQVEVWGSVHKQADLWQLEVETSLVDCGAGWSRLSQLSMLFPDGILCFLASDGCLLPEDPPAVNRSSSVGRGVDGGGGTTTGIDGRLDLEGNIEILQSNNFVIL